MSISPLALRGVVLRGVQGLALVLLASTLASADTSVRPSPRVNYRQASKYGRTALSPLTYSDMVVPSWIGKSDTFWYSYRTSKGTRFWKVDPVKKSRDALFDHEKLGSRLAELTRKPIDANALPITRGQISTDGERFSFVHDELLYQYDLKSEKLVSRGKAPTGPPTSGGGFGGRSRRGADDEESQVKTGDKDMKGKEETDRTKGPSTSAGGTVRATSPDNRFVLMARNNNLYLAEAGKEKEAAPLTKDGSEDYRFLLATGGQTSGHSGRGGTGFGRPPGSLTPATTWAKDSKTFFAYRSDKRNVKELFVVNSLSLPRPTLHKYPYSMPGEDAIYKTELYVGSVEAKAILRVKPRWRDESYRDFHWGKEPNELRFVRMDRLLRNFDLCSVDTRTGDCKAIVSEGFENANVVYERPRYLQDSDEMICWSERTGWGHFYLHGRDGKLKNAITSGAFRASRIVHLDEKTRTMWFVGNAREKGENVYYQHLYSVKLDGTGLKLLDPGDSYHLSMLSPSRKYLVDTATRIDQVPESCVRDADGKKVMDLERADLSRLLEFGWQMPETFTVKAADGVTDLYGNIWKPFDFDAKKKYPVIANVYPGPQQEGVSHTFTAYSSTMQLAQLGFIVIQVGHRGGAPTRSKAYASYGYFNLRDYGLADKKAVIEQLAARHPWIDLTKVGIYGHSGGGFMSAAALLQKPYNEFFKAAVASAGNHDNNIYNNAWSERYHGMKEVAARPDDGAPAAPPTKATPKTKFEIKVPTNAELAANLKGRLLLVHGEADSNVHPANTLRLADALMKANKRFDMMILPATAHSFGAYSPYFQQRMWEFFAEHLLGDRRTGADLSDKDGE